MTVTGVKEYGNYEAFATTWASSYQPVKLHQSYGSSHTLGIAFQNTSGNWSQSGTFSYQEYYSGSGDKANLTDQRVYNQVNYQQVRCGQLYTNALLGYAWIPASIYAISSCTVFMTPHPIWSACAPYNNGDVMTKTSGTNVTYSGGISWHGIGLTAQAGWSSETSETSETWNFENSSYLCGNTASGPFSSPQAEAHSR